MNNTLLPPAAGGAYLRLPDGRLELIPDDPVEATPTDENAGTAEAVDPAKQATPTTKKKGVK